MFVRRTKKTHDEVDFGVLESFFSSAEQLPSLTGEMITSPWHLYSVEKLRDQYSLRVSPQTPTDVFLFGKGEPDNPAVTKIGGLPVWPSSETWPIANDELPAYFVAQINFSDSQDILAGKLPGDILLVLSHDPEFFTNESELFFRWLPKNVSSTCSEARPVFSPFFGAIHRTFDYARAIRIADRLDVSQQYHLPILAGTKIGGVPGPVGRSHRKMLFLGQIASIQPSALVPFPWINVEKRQGFKEIYAKGNNACFGDMGEIRLFLDKKDEVHPVFSMY